MEAVRTTKGCQFWGPHAMAFVGTIYRCQFWVAHEDGSSGDHVMTVLEPKCGSSGGEDIRILIL
jgi:hypothetical protein